jgi:hypothetical protein
VKQSERQVDHDLSPPSIVKVKNEWRCISAAHVCLHGVDQEGCTFLYYCFMLSLAAVMLFILFCVTSSKNYVKFIKFTKSLKLL